MIFHDGRFKEKGYIIEDLPDWGCVAIVSPTKIPIPNNDKALSYHLRRGAILVNIMYEPPLFDMYYLKVLDRMKDKTAAKINQRLLLLVADNGDGVREVFRSVARNWILHGGASFILDGIDNVYLQLKKFEKGVVNVSSS